MQTPHTLIHMNSLSRNSGSAPDLGSLDIRDSFQGFFERLAYFCAKNLIEIGLMGEKSRGKK